MAVETPKLSARTGFTNEVMLVSFVDMQFLAVCDALVADTLHISFQAGRGVLAVTVDASRHTLTLAQVSEQNLRCWPPKQDPLLARLLLNLCATLVI